ncbi:MAG: hypothetical protein BRD52_05065 [Bacteroidetes bacterium SW_4_67_19]|nr:MAG: hypothetical protein BRD52_05065 [Bacteroidetes bacterium SW_4_67_19]
MLGQTVTLDAFLPQEAFQKRRLLFLSLASMLPASKRLRTAALVFCVAVLAAGCETPADDAPAEDTAAPLGAEAKSALAALPAEARLLTVVDARALRRSGLFDRDSTRATRNASDETGAQRLKGFLEAAGFTPAEDVRTVYFAAPKGDEPPQLVVAADFERARLRKQLAGEPGSSRFDTTTHRGATLYRLARGGEGRSHAFALTADELMLLSTSAGVRRMLDRREAGTNSAGDSDRLMRLADRVRGRASTWFVTRGVLGGMPGGPSGQDANARRVQQVVRNTAGAVSVSDRVVEGEVFLYTRDGAAPADLREVLEGLVSAAGRSGADDVVPSRLRMVLDGLASVAGRSNDRRSSRKRQILESLDIKEAGDHAVRVGFALPLDGAQ